MGLQFCDAVPPTFDSLTATPNELWPPNHKLVPVPVTAVASANAGPAPEVTLVSVESNEPDNGWGDGHTTGDIVILDDFHFKLRKERSGGGDERVYTMTYEATDVCGNAATATAVVTVPKSKKDHGKQWKSKGWNHHDNKGHGHGKGRG